MYDTIEKIGKSSIQHGSYNNRIYLMKLDKSDYPGIIGKMDVLAARNHYTKIFAKIPAWAVEGFQAEGYVKEAFIPGFYNGETDVYFCSRFIDQNRAIPNTEATKLTDTYIKLALSKKGKSITVEKRPAYPLRVLDETDIAELATLYGTVFRSYPFPIFEQSYLKETMRENVIYYGIFNNDKLIAASSAEMDVTAQNAEMTDFATDPEFTGNNFSLVLLREMEAGMRKRDMKILCTIARSFSAGMNITFAKQNYTHSGTLINNTNIFGNIESMNVWWKRLD